MILFSDVRKVNERKRPLVDDALFFSVIFINKISFFRF